MATALSRSARIAGFLAGGLCLTACTRDAGPASASPATLRIAQQNWSGESRAQPAAAATTHQVTAGTEIPLASVTGSATLRVTAKGDAVEFAIANVARVNDGGGVNLNSCGEQRYTLRVGETARFATCSLDAGATWTVERVS